jgi:hypothetical protein
MNNEKLHNVKNAVNDMYSKLNTILYKDMGKKGGLVEVNPSTLVVENFKFIIDTIQELDDNMLRSVNE